MINHNGLPLSVPIALLTLLLGACTAATMSAKVEDSQLDQLLRDMDQSLENQGTVNAHLQEQQRQLESQHQRLELLTRDVGKVLAKSDTGTCPPAEVCPEEEGIPDKQVVGALEQVWFSRLGLALTARIDTGAETASLDARNIERFERNGKRWVRFEILNPETGEPVLVERSLKRTVGIIQAGTSEAERRPVIKLRITIGDVSQTAEFTLSNRSHLGERVMIGRNILQDVMVVDVSKKYVAPYVLPQNPPEVAP